MAQLLQGDIVPATLDRMSKKTEQVRITADLAKDARVVAAANGESLPDYVERILRAAVARDMPKVAKQITKRAQDLDNPPPAP